MDMPVIPALSTKGADVARTGRGPGADATVTEPRGAQWLSQMRWYADGAGMRGWRCLRWKGASLPNLLEKPLERRRGLVPLLSWRPLVTLNRPRNVILVVSAAAASSAYSTPN